MMNDDNSKPKASDQQRLRLDWGIAKATTYGGVLLIATGKILLREPANHFDGYVWTFAKGRPDPGESPDQTAMREVLEETGYETEVVDVLPGVYKGGTSTCAMFVLRHLWAPTAPGWETSSIHWASFDKAEYLIKLSVNSVGRTRDLKILQSAKQWFEENHKNVMLPVS